MANQTVLLTSPAPPHTLTDAFRWQFLFVFLSLFSMRHTVNIERKCTIVWLLLLWTLARRPMLTVALLLLVDGQKNRVFRENFNTNRSEFCLCTSAFKMLFTLNSFDFLLVNVTVFLRGSNTYYHCSFSMQSIRWKLLTNTKEKHGNNMQTYACIRIQSPLNVCSIYWFFHVNLFLSLFLSKSKHEQIHTAIQNVINWKVTVVYICIIWL